MITKLVITAPLLILPLASYGNPVKLGVHRRSNETLHDADRTILARAADPSDYPLQSGPFINEFKYLNWDSDDEDQKAQLEKIHTAFGEWRQMAMEALSKITGDNRDDTMVERWFGDPDDPEEPIDVFKNMWDSDTGQPTENVAKMVCNREDFKDACETETLAYTDADTGEFHFCLRGLEKPLNFDIDCDDLDASCSLKMRSMPMTLLHEMTHFNDIGAAARGSLAIIDNARGAYDCFQLSSDDKGENAQNYAWFAGEAHWSNYCDRTFEDPEEGIS